MIKYEHFTGYTKWFNLHLVLQIAMIAVAIQRRLGAMVVSLSSYKLPGMASGYAVILVIMIIIIPFWVGINTLFPLTRWCPNILAPPRMTSLL
jgi:hypothetical protein